jgi:hypothetical protein
MREFAIDLIRGQVVKRLMRPFTVVKREPFLEAFSQIKNVIERPQIQIMILQGPPQPFDENVVLKTSAPIDVTTLQPGYLISMRPAKTRICLEIKDPWFSVLTSQ